MKQFACTARYAREWLHEARYGGLRTVTAEDVVEELIERIEADDERPKACTVTDEQRAAGHDCDNRTPCLKCTAANAERELDCGMSKEKREDGEECPVYGYKDLENCAACTIFALKRAADCGNEDRTEPCASASGHNICLACQLARSQSALCRLEEGGAIDEVAALEKKLEALTKETEERLERADTEMRATRAERDCGITPSDRAKGGVHCASADDRLELCTACWAAKILGSAGGPMSPDVAALHAELAEARREAAANLEAADQARTDGIAIVRAELLRVTAERDALRLSSPPPAARPKRAARQPRPGEVSLFDLLRVDDLVVTVAAVQEPAPAQATGRACGCQSRGPHRVTCARVGQTRRRGVAQ